MLVRLFTLFWGDTYLLVGAVVADDFDVAFGSEFSDDPAVFEKLIADSLQSLNQGAFWIHANGICFAF